MYRKLVQVQILQIQIRFIISLAHLNVSKKIVNANGTATTPDDEFAFTATFAFPKGTDANTLGGIKANGGDVTLAEGGTYTFHLKANKT